MRSMDQLVRNLDDLRPIAQTLRDCNLNSLRRPRTPEAPAKCKVENQCRSKRRDYPAALVSRSGGNSAARVADQCFCASLHFAGASGVLGRGSREFRRSEGSSTGTHGSVGIRIGGGHLGSWSTRRCQSAGAAADDTASNAPSTGCGHLSGKSRPGQARSLAHAHPTVQKCERFPRRRELFRNHEAPSSTT